ncbi:hypothetical protein COT72_00550 [archaeon CG10_big_fil_rev_8_21_14_0_10_43_11]|nr:MAG: hypothetical protein COT72_00550 [archaeon CG10_big_fil_rev_8_21_14_0_10_43_11]
MRKIFTILIFGMLLLSVSLVFAHEHDFNETKQLIDSGISCDKLTDEQLESFGDYYMEQMHTGEAHEMRDNMMGGEGSESLRQVHINMAKRLYCNEDVGGLMGGGMMNMSGSGMMGNYPTYYGYNSFWNILWLIFLIGAIALMVWLIYKFTKNWGMHETPVNILQKRYAKGEISKKQFEEMRKELNR